MSSNRTTYQAGVLLILFFLASLVQATTRQNVMKVDEQKVNAWNQFAELLVQLHEVQLAQYETHSKTQTGGYAGRPAYYEETVYYDSASGQILSRIKRVKDQPELVHEIEVNIYDAKMQLQRDYLAAYLPDFRNAPIQTLINLHNHDNALHAFRQFDASGEYIYEQCQGEFSGKPVFISLEEHEFGAGPYRRDKILNSKAYQACFGELPVRLGEQHYPQAVLQRISGVTDAVVEDDINLAALVERYTSLLADEPANPSLLLRRADLYFKLQEFDLAIEDYSAALELDAKLDVAYYGRGMALGRSGRIAEGITDLTEYLRRHPDSSLAYTKRGVRYLWLGEEARAQADFERALTLDAQNAEAHDDLGVILARQGRHEQALTHFQATVRIDPTYFKAHHNLAMVYYITGRNGQALTAVDRALALQSQARDSLLLKAQILEAMGKLQEASVLREQAEFAPEGNWTEHITVN